MDIDSEAGTTLPGEVGVDGEADWMAKTTLAPTSFSSPFFIGEVLPAQSEIGVVCSSSGILDEE